MTHPFRFGVHADGVGTIKHLRDLATRAEDLGYDVLSVSDHLAVHETGPIAAMSAAAACTTDLRVGSLVFCNDFRDPRILAAELRTLCELYGDRVEVGLGAGWMAADYDVLGRPMPPIGQRLDDLAEAVGLLRGLVDSPILMGGGGRRMLTLAAQLADIVGINAKMSGGKVTSSSIATVTADSAAEKVAWVRAAAGARFAELELQELLFLVAVDDRWSARSAKLEERFGVAPSSPQTLVGSVASCVEELHRRRDELGISYFTVRDVGLERLAPVVAQLAGC